MFGRMHVAPVLLGFLAKHPQVRVRSYFSDQIVHLLDEGFDVAVRGNFGLDATLDATLGADKTLSVTSIESLGVEAGLKAANRQAAGGGGGPPAAPAEKEAFQFGVEASFGIATGQVALAADVITTDKIAFPMPLSNDHGGKVVNRAFKTVVDWLVTHNSQQRFESPRVSITRFEFIDATLGPLGAPANRLRAEACVRPEEEARYARGAIPPGRSGAAPCREWSTPSPDVCPKPRVGHAYSLFSTHPTAQLFAIMT